MYSLVLPISLLRERDYTWKKDLPSHFRDLYIYSHLTTNSIYIPK